LRRGIKFEDPAGNLDSVVSGVVRFLWLGSSSNPRSSLTISVSMNALERVDRNAPDYPTSITLA